MAARLCKPTSAATFARPSPLQTGLLTPGFARLQRTRPRTRSLVAVAAADGSQPGDGFRGICHTIRKGLAILPLLAAAVIAPSAAHAAWLQAHRPVPAPMASIAAPAVERPLQAKDEMYPSWQRLQWQSAQTWGELMNSSAQTQARLASAMLGTGIMLFLALKFILSRSSYGAVADMPQKQEQGRDRRDTLESPDGGAAGRRRQEVGAAAASAAGSKLLKTGGVDRRAASQPSRPTVQEVRRQANSAVGAVMAPLRSASAPSPPARVPRQKPSSASPISSPTSSETPASLARVPRQPLGYSSDSSGSSAGNDSKPLMSADKIYDPLFHGDAAGGDKTAGSTTAEPKKPGSSSSQTNFMAKDNTYEPLFHGDAAAEQSSQTSAFSDAPQTGSRPAAEETEQVEGAFPDDIDALANEIARGGRSGDVGFPDNLDQLAAEVAGGRTSGLPAGPSSQPAYETTYGREVPARGSDSTASTTQSGAAALSLALGFFKVAFDTIRDPKGTLTSARSGAPGRVLAVHRNGQSLMVSMRSAGGAVDGSTAAERAERSVLTTAKPLGGLLRAKVARPAEERRWAAYAKYDMFHEALKASADAVPDKRYNPVRAVLAAVPPAGRAKYDMLQGLLQGTVHAPPKDSKYDIVWQLLRAGREAGATSGPQYEPIHDLMRTVAYAADWGYSLPSWASELGLEKYDIVQAAFGVRAPVARSKYDPLQSAFAAEAPTGSSKYDMVGELLAAAQAAPEHVPASDPLQSTFSFMRQVVGIDPAPAGESRYDPWAWLQTRQHSTVSGTQVIRAGHLGVEAPGKYDPAAPLLGLLSGPPPETPDDPLRLVLRRAAAAARGELPDMTVERALVFRGGRNNRAVAVPVTAAGGTTPGGKWSWSKSFWGRGEAQPMGQAASAPRTAAAVDSVADAAAARPIGNDGPADDSDTAYDPVPDLMKLWSALKASSAKMDPLDAVNVISSRGAGDEFFRIASAYRRMAEDADLRTRHRSLWTVVEATHGRLSLPTPSPVALKAAQALLRDTSRQPQYKPIHNMLQGRDSKQVVRVLCVLDDLLVTPAPQQAPPHPSPIAFAT